MRSSAASSKGLLVAGIRKRQISHLKWKAAKLGFQIVEAAAA
jgi:hypothetical protein